MDIQVVIYAMLVLLGFLFGLWYARRTVHPYCGTPEDGKVRAGSETTHMSVGAPR
jgi:hypothetical protein